MSHQEKKMFQILEIQNKPSQVPIFLRFPNKRIEI